MEWIGWFNDWSGGGVLIRLLLALIAGIIIGMDREYRNKGAGIRTHALVCVGSALMMMIGEYMYREFPHSNIDVSRIGAQVVSGIGFLGAGTIIVTGRMEIKGLTTAAGLWAASGVGLAIGAGFLKGAFYSFILIMVVLKMLYRVDYLFHSESKDMDVFIQFSTLGNIQKFLHALRDREIYVSDFHIHNDNTGTGHPVATMTLSMPKHGMKREIYNFIETFNGIDFVEEIG